MDRRQGALSIPRRLCDRKSRDPNLLGASFAWSFPLINYLHPPGSHSLSTAHPSGSHYLRYILRGDTLDSVYSRESLSTVHPPGSHILRYIFRGVTLYGTTSGHPPESHVLRYINRGVTLDVAALGSHSQRCSVRGDALGSPTTEEPVSTVQPPESRSRRSNLCEEIGSTYTNKYTEWHVYSKEQHQRIRQRIIKNVHVFIKYENIALRTSTHLCTTATQL